MANDTQEQHMTHENRVGGILHVQHTKIVHVLCFLFSPLKHEPEADEYLPYGRFLILVRECEEYFLTCMVATKLA